MSQPPAPPTPLQRPTLPRGVIGVLMAVMLTGGMVTGAVLGPASAGSLTSSSPIVQRALALLAAQALSASHTRAAVPSTPAAEGNTNTVNQARPVHVGTSKLASRAGSPQAAPPNSSSSESAAGTRSSSEGSSSEGPSKGEKAASGHPIRLPPIQHVWLIVLSGSTFADAATAPSGYPYLVGQLVKQGMLLTSYSALDSYELAGDAALLPGGVGASLSAISEPGCGTAPTPGAGAPCTIGAQPSPSEADAFVRQVVGPIIASPAYREDGLIVITFAPTSSSAGVPATTLALQPAAGALLLSPLLHGGARSSNRFDSLSPRTSLETIFGH